MLSPLTRLIFPAHDDQQLTYLYEDNMKIEPEWYCPILPMVLVNGCDGIGTGYSTNVPNYDPREIVANLKRMMAGMEPTEMVTVLCEHACVCVNTYTCTCRLSKQLMFMTCSTVSTRTLQKPWYKSFTGTMAHIEPQKYMVYGNIARLSPTSLEITELPIRSWTQAYKENVLEPMLHGTEKAPPFITYVQTELWGGGGGGDHPRFESLVLSVQ